MNTSTKKQSIRILKRNERDLLNQQSVALSNQSKTENQSRREMVATIASWIEERRAMITLPRIMSSLACSCSADQGSLPAQLTAKGCTKLNTKLSNTFLLAALLALVISADATAQRITSLTATAKGQGTVTISDVDKHKINAVLVILRENGEAEITLYAEMQLSGQATWSAGEDLSQGIDLKITGGVVSGNATGTGKLFLRDDRKSIARLTISAAAGDGTKVKVEFTADEKTKEPQYEQPR